MPFTDSIDWSAAAAWIALIVAIISPIATAIISNAHQSKIKRLEIMEQRGLKIIEDYLAVTSREILTTGISDNYQKCYAQIFLYTPKKLHKDLEELNRLISHPVNNMFPDKEKCSCLLLKISKELTY